LFDKFGENDNFKANAKFLLFDFNGEYSYSDCITKHKKIYDLSTKDTKDTNKYQRIPLLEEDLLDVNLLSILANATEKTQQPFIKRAVSLYKKVKSSQNNISYYHNILQKLLKHILTMQDGVRASLLLDYFEEILPKYDSDGDEFNYRENIDWNATLHTFTINIENKTKYMNSNIDKECISNLDLYTNIDTLNFNEDFLVTIIKFLYIQLIYDVLNSRAQNEHIAPAINKLKAAQKDFDKIFVIDKSNSFWAEDNFVVINLNKVNISMKKLIPMLLSVKLYSEHKKLKDKEALSHSLNIIIDEAHNVLSYESLRESETWKDFRLETFEEIIKEGRKFGVFMTIASQRPSDISPTIISQLHNYFIHRLINNRDIDMVEKAISFLDQLSIDTLPILPTGACILSGTITELPVIVQIDKIDELYKPHSDNIELVKNWI